MESSNAIGVVSQGSGEWTEKVSSRLRREEGRSLERRREFQREKRVENAECRGLGLGEHAVREANRIARSVVR